MNAADVPPVSRPGSSPEPHSISVSNRQGFRRRRGPGGKGKAALRQDAPPAEDVDLDAPARPGDAEDGHIVDVRA